MTCHDCDQRLGEYVDGTLPPSGAAEIGAHLAECLRCAGLAADCLEIRALARMLERQLPPARVWHTLAEATRTPPAWRSMQAIAAAWRPAAAAAMILAFATSLWWTGARLSAVTAPARTGASVTFLANGADHEHRTAESGYASTIARLEALTDAQRAALDPEMADVLAGGMAVIDTAIDQSRAALATAPESTVARDSLFQALRSKVELLQETLTLMSVMRNGAARMTGGMNP
jgi:anti-sigma factor RsiW